MNYVSDISRMFHLKLFLNIESPATVSLNCSSIISIGNSSILDINLFLQKNFPKFLNMPCKNIIVKEKNDTLLLLIKTTLNQ